MPPSSSEVITAVGHPTRRRILRVFVDDFLRRASTGEVADVIEQPIAQVGYHLKTLAHCEILRLSKDGDPSPAGDPGYGWCLEVEADWLRVVLDVWTELEPSR